MGGKTDRPADPNQPPGVPKYPGADNADILAAMNGRWLNENTVWSTPMTRNGRPSTTKFQWVYNDKRWYAARARALRRSGWKCQHCKADVRKKHAARVDHIIKVSDDVSKAFDDDNLRVLCTSCDAARHREKGGGGKASERPEIGLDGWPVE